MKKVLVIGCGNIGALYDLERNDILTHVKAFSLDYRFHLTICDNDPKILSLLVEKYNCKSILNSELTTDELDKYDLITIATPTDTHYEYLFKALNAKAKIIICEKPISLDLSRLNSIKNKYIKSSKKILVNYTRRFQPSYQEIKNNISTILKNERITNISIRYQRGFLNNCSHAIDTLEFLLGVKIDFDFFQKFVENYDAFEFDPTLNALGFQDGINFSIVGFANVKFSFFEIDICFQTYKVSLINSGRDCIVSKSKSNGRYFQPLDEYEILSLKNCLNDQMKHVISHSYNFFEDNELPDNFLDSIELNYKMLKFINN